MLLNFSGSNKKEDGYIALISVIMLSLVLITVISALSSDNYFSRYNILENEYKQRSSGLAEACVEYAFGKLAANPGYAGNNETFMVGNSTCQVSAVSPPGSFPKIISTTGTYPRDGPQKSYTNLSVGVDSNLRITFWQETP